MTNSAMSRPLPYNIEAEEAVLGSIMIHNAMMERVNGIVTPKDFYREKHQQIFEVAQEMYRVGTPIDPLTLADELDKRGWLADVGGPAAISDLFSRVPTAIHAEYYANIVNSDGMLRRLVEAAEKIAKLAYEDGVSGAQASAQAEDILLNVTRKGKRNDVVRAGEGAEQVFEELQLIHMGQVEPALPVSLPKLGRLLRGWRRKQQTVLAAPTGVGKTTFVVSEMLFLARRGYKGLFFSIEMPMEEIASKCLGWLSGVDWEQILMGFAPEDRDEIEYPFRRRSKEDLEAVIAVATEELRSLPLYIVAAQESEGRVVTPDFSVNGIRSTTLNLADKIGGIDVFGVDNMNIMEFPDVQRGDQRRDYLGDAGMEMKKLAVTTDSHCFAIAQLNRAAQGADVATHHHIGESAKLVHNANVALVMDDPAAKGKDDGDPWPGEEERTFNLSKKRGGRKGYLSRVYMNGATGWFSDDESRRLDKQAQSYSGEW